MTSGHSISGRASVTRINQGWHSPDLNGDDLSEVWIGIDEDPLDKIIAELIRADLSVLADVKKLTKDWELTVDQWHAWISGRRARGDGFEITFEEFVATNLEKLLDDLGSILIHAVLGSLG